MLETCSILIFMYHSDILWYIVSLSANVLYFCKSLWKKASGKCPKCKGKCECKCSLPLRGTIVKARDKLYHPQCFMCDDCGLNLKQRGYFFIEENLYCETHAKARVQPPEGYDVVAVYPNSKVELVWEERWQEEIYRKCDRARKREGGVGGSPIL